MLAWLSQIGNFLLMIVDLVIMSVKSIVQFFTMLPEWLAFLHGGILFIPGILAPFALLGILISVIFLIVGRN